MPSDDRYQEVIRTLSLLFRADQVIEIRALGDDGVSSGYYIDHKAAANDLLIRDNDPRVHGIYVTLQEVRPELLARRANRMKFRVERKDPLTADADIIRRRWLPIDIDPVRPSGISSSASERADALALADTISQFLFDLGWPSPLIGDSGNGAHLLYPIDLPNDEESKDLIHRVLETLHIRFSNSRCKVDTANGNAGRIWKVYGTVSRKGDEIPDRPHRRSRILSVPAPSGVLPVEKMEKLISLFPVSLDGKPGKAAWKTGEVDVVTQSVKSKQSKQFVQSSPSSPYQQTAHHSQSFPNAQSSQINLGTWLSDHQIGATAKPYHGGTLFVLDSCPFSSDHADGAYAIQFQSGAIFAGCHHNSCGNGTQRWAELRAQYEPEKPDVGTRLTELRRDRIRKKYASESGDADEPLMDVSDPKTRRSFDDLEDDENIRIQADEILSCGDPLAYLLATFAKSHEGDQTVAECLIHSLVSRTVINSKGLHVSITGESGKGKSHAMDTMRTLIPKRFRLDGRLSDKALFYMEDLIPGTVITLDDVGLSDQMQEILKGVTTSFQKPFPYRTVNKDRKAQVCIIPERCIWWIAKVEGAGDDQVFNRMLTCWIDDSEEQDLRVLERTLSNAEQMPGSEFMDDQDIRVCRQIWEGLSPVFVVIPYARKIRFQSSENRRNPDMLLDLIRTNAALNQQQREKKIVGSITSIIATKEDFEQAARLFVALNGETGGQGNKLTKRESALIEKIASLNIPEVTTVDLQQITGWACGTIGKLIHGHRSYGKSYSGLLEKCPAISHLDRTVMKGDGGYTTSRRTRIYSWDPVLYASWLKGGCVWLIDDDAKPDLGEGPSPGPDTNEGQDTASDPSGCREDSSSDDAARGEGKHMYPGSSAVSDSSECDDSPKDTETHEHRESGLASIHVADHHGETIPSKSFSVSDDSDSFGIALSSVDPRDYLLLDGLPDRRRCNVCGKKPTQYQERMTTRRLKEAPRMNRMLCVSCYQMAVSRAAAAIIPLPGLIDTNVMIRRDHSIGLCHVCNLRPAVWSDPDNRVNLCDACYDRESQRTGRHIGSLPDDPPR